MRKLFSSSASVLLSWGVLSVQSVVAQSSVHIGPMAGVDFANLHGADVNSFVGVGTQSRTAFAAGGFATIGLGKNFAVEAQIFYVGKGAKASASGVDVALKLNYVEVPLLLKTVFPLAGPTRVVPNLFAGPAVAFRTTCNIKASSGGLTAEQSCSDAGLPVKSTDFILAFGGGLDIGPLAVQVRYDLGLTKVGDVAQPADIKTQAWLVSVGYTLPIGTR